MCSQTIKVCDSTPPCSRACTEFIFRMAGARSRAESGHLGTANTALSLLGVLLGRVNALRVDSAIAWLRRIDQASWDRVRVGEVLRKALPGFPQPGAHRRLAARRPAPAVEAVSTLHAVVFAGILRGSSSLSPQPSSLRTRRQ